MKNNGTLDIHTTSSRAPKFTSYCERMIFKHNFTEIMLL